MVDQHRCCLRLCPLGGAMLDVYQTKVASNTCRRIRVDHMDGFLYLSTLPVWCSAFDGRTDRLLQTRSCFPADTGRRTGVCRHWSKPVLPLFPAPHPHHAGNHLPGSARCNGGRRSVAAAAEPALARHHDTWVRATGSAGKRQCGQHHHAVVPAASLRRPIFAIPSDGPAGKIFWGHVSWQ